MAIRLLPMLASLRDSKHHGRRETPPPGRRFARGPAARGSILPPAAALAAANEQRPAARIQVAVNAVAGTAHDGDDLLDRWRVGRIATASLPHVHGCRSGAGPIARRQTPGPRPFRRSRTAIAT